MAALPEKMDAAAEEQATEREALAAIFADDYTEHGDGSFAVVLDSTPEELELPPFDRARLLVTYTESYPATVPELALDAERLTAAQKDELLKSLRELAAESVGMAMVYTLVSHGKELIGDRFPPSVAEPEEEVSTVPTDCAPARLVKDGTVCTPETFLMWKRKFDAEMLQLAITQGLDVEQSTRLTGRQYFEQAKAQEQLKDEDFIVDDEGEDFEDLLFARLQTGEFESDDDEDDEDEDFVPDDDDEDDA